MSQKWFLRILCTFLVVPILLLLDSPVQAQDPTSTPNTQQQVLIEAIQARAQRDAETEKAPENISGLNLLFGEQAKIVDLTLPQVLEIYEDAYNTAKPVKPWWADIQPGVGWTVAIILFILLILRDVIKEWITNFFKKIGRWIYAQLSGSHLLRRTNLKKYQQALRKKYARLYIPFRPNKPLNLHEVYVPLKVAGSQSSEQIEVMQAIAQHRRLMVTGPPGSGKSTLLKHITLAYAEGRLVDLPDHPIPILLELNRLNESGLSIKEHLIAELTRNDFPKSDHFVNNSLSQGTLALLFDGLDEVNSNQRLWVVRWIRNLIDEYENCRVIITCRTAVYKGEFNVLVDQTLEIAEFNDQQIRRFLKSWADDMPPKKSIEQLMQTLHDRPRIMALARNPLLLTIIAYLYTDTPSVLPHSRAEFYQQATDILLRQWHQEQNQFEARDKQLLLQHLALYNQDSAVQHQKDRRSMNYQIVLTEVRKILPNLNLPLDTDRAIVNEIVERSGLLLAIDGGTRYQFAHLTLQEFFAAAELINDSKGLLQRFKTDTDTWRETAKLWCGLAPESSTFIWRIYQIDAITAFECLADARKVRPRLLDEIGHSFKEQLGKPSDMHEAIIRAFAAVASDLRPRGRTILEFLKNTLTTDSDTQRREAVASALSLTNLPEAAQILGTQYSKIEARSALLQMGDLAVPVLLKLAEKGFVNALDDLRAIGTPKSAEVLVSLLWSKHKSLAIQGAWHLASIFYEPNVKNVLRDYQLSETQRQSEWLNWVWQPFNEPANSSLPIIAGRVVSLIGQIPLKEKVKEGVEFDVRLAIPLCLTKVEETNFHVSDLWDWGPTIPNKVRSAIRFVGLDIDELNKLQSNSRKERIQTAADQLIQGKKRPVTNSVQLLEETLKSIASSNLQYMISTLPKNLQVNFVYRLIRGPQPTINDWRNIFRPIKYSFEQSWHYRSVIVLALLTSLVWFIQTASVILSATTLLILENIVMGKHILNNNTTSD